MEHKCFANHQIARHYPVGDTRFTSRRSIYNLTLPKVGLYLGLFISLYPFTQTRHILCTQVQRHRVIPLGPNLELLYRDNSKVKQPLHYTGVVLHARIRLTSFICFRLSDVHPGGGVNMTVVEASRWREIWMIMSSNNHEFQQPSSPPSAHPCTSQWLGSFIKLI